jgi:hypothetical protein
MEYLADDDQGIFLGRLQASIAERIEASPIVKTWCRLRAPLKELKHFSKYRRRHFDRYHAAARAMSAGNADKGQKALVEGLDKEIGQSKIIVPRNQVLFHGRADELITHQRPYATFISTSLHPIVARNRAITRAGIDGKNGKPLVCILKLLTSLPVLWGHVGKSHEYELLLPRNLIATEVNRHVGKNFVVATLEVTTESL